MSWQHAHVHIMTDIKQKDNHLLHILSHPHFVFILDVILRLNARLDVEPDMIIQLLVTRPSPPCTRLTMTRGEIRKEQVTRVVGGFQDPCKQDPVDESALECSSVGLGSAGHEYLTARALGDEFDGFFYRRRQPTLVGLPIGLDQMPDEVEIST